VPAIQPYIIDPIWQQLRALLPERETNHPLGCHRPRIPDRVVFEKLVAVLLFGCAYWRIADKECSATTLRRRRVDRGRSDGRLGGDGAPSLRPSHRSRSLGRGRRLCITKAPCGGENVTYWRNLLFGSWTKEGRASGASHARIVR
jgi:transposase